MRAKKSFITILLLIFSLAFLTHCSSTKKKEEQEKMMAEAAKAEQNKKDEMAKKEEAKKMAKPVWGYTGLFGPELWGNLDPNFKACKEGKLQSPINLVWRKPGKDNRVDILYKPMPVEIMDDMRAILLNGHKDSVISIQGDVYTLKNMTYRSGSEHTLSKKKYPLELQFGHQNAAGKWAYVSVFVVDGPQNPTLETILNSMPETKNKYEVAGKMIDPSLLIPAIKTHYKYEGSLTHPPCTEGVTWIVFNTPITASKSQLAGFKAVYNDNVRPLQELNGRPISNF